MVKIMKCSDFTVVQWSNRYVFRLEYEKNSSIMFQLSERGKKKSLFQNTSSQHNKSTTDMGQDLGFIGVKNL